MTETVPGRAEATIKSSDKQRHPLQPLIDALGRAVAKTGIHPDVLTLLSLVVAAGATALLVLGELLVAPFVYLAAGLLDVLDGAVARHNGKTSLKGGYLDSIIDRYVDFLVLFGIMLYLDAWHMWVLGSIALFGTLMTSAARWRVHEDHHPTRDEWGRDILGRAGRLTLLLVGILGAGVIDRFGTRGGAGGEEILVLTVGILALLANLTVVQRIVKARRVLRRAEQK